MSRKLPPLNHLRAFEAAARHESFKHAAQELHVTQAAVSHLVKALEEELGRQLFHRKSRGLRLTEEARVLAEELTRHLDGIERATASFAGASLTGVLKISCVPAFGYRFIMPALDRFHAMHPELQVDLVLDAKIVDLESAEFDGAIRYGRGGWKGLEAWKLQADEMTPAATPDFAAGLSLPASAEEIVSLPYVVSPGGAADWETWCRANGAGEVQRQAPISLENRAVALDYLLLGKAVGLVDVRFASNELAEGRLVRLHDSAVVGTNATWLVAPRSPVPDPRIEIFRDWLGNEFFSIDPGLGCPWRS